MTDYKDLLFRLSASFINLPLDRVDAAIGEALGRMGRFVDADRAYVFSHDLCTATTRNTHEWCGTGIAPQIDNLQAIPLKDLPDWLHPHSRGELIHIPEVDALPPGPLRDLLSSQDILSLICLPMIGKAGYQGFVGFDSVRRHRRYSGEEIRLLGLFANLLLSVEERRLAEQGIAESEERLRLALEAANQGLFDLDLVSGQAVFSPEYGRLLDYDPGSFQETWASWQARLHPDEQARVLGIFADCLQGRIPCFRVECRQRTRSGDWKWILCLGRVQARGTDGRPLRMLGTQTDISELKKAEAQIHHLAYYDPVTRLPNRSLLLDRLSQNLARTGRHGRQGALLWLGLDQFKDFNVTQGHVAGDRLLVEVARRLTASIGAGDTVASLGGDEFVILLEELESEAGFLPRTESLGMRILASLREPFEWPPARPHHATASLGIVLFKDQSAPAEELLKRAFTAMYEAKTAGGDALRYFDPRTQTALNERAALIRDLRGVVEQGQLLAFFQPQVDDSGRVMGAEMLMRWDHPTRGRVPTGEFIRLAEETGLILPMGEWMLEQACATLATWARLPAFTGLSLSVNVSARQFGLANLLDRILWQAGQAGACVDKLKLELTESLLLKDADHAITRMQALREQGIGIALDDFGTGYSSLTYLKRLPLDQLKIDQSFVREVATNPSDAAIIRAIIALADSLGISVVAEGVETLRQRHALRRLGCRLYQGYLYGRPLPADAFASLVLGQDRRPMAPRARTPHPHGPA